MKIEPPAELRWHRSDIRLPEDGELVWTKIHDADGERNVQLLRKKSNLWFTPSYSMYVYYRPTHWASI